MKDLAEIKRQIEEDELLRMFPSNSVGSAVGRQALAALREVISPDERAGVRRMAAVAASYVDFVFRRGAYRREGDMAQWFALPDMGLAGLAQKWDELAEAWRGRPDGDDPGAEEEESIERAEDEGFYGRTLRHCPECEDWIYIRFGRMPAAGRSEFGLAAADTEDGPDQWREEMGGMTHEAGISVFRAYRHPDVVGAYVILPHAFDMALYGIPDFDRYLLAVIPQYEPGEHPTVLRIDGSPVTVKAPDGTIRLELGSDGELLIDTGKPHPVERLSLETVWVSETASALDFLRERRGYELPEFIASSPSPPG